MSTQDSPRPVMSDAQFHDTVRSAGGATRTVLTRAAYRGGVDPGYAVGGKTNAEGHRFPERSVDMQAFTPAVVGQHLDALRGHFGDNDPTLHQGAWVEGDKVVLDASDVYRSKGRARVEGLARGERAIYDMKNAQDVNLPRRAVK